MTIKTLWITNQNALDYNNGADSNVYYNNNSSLLSVRPEFNSVSNKSIVLPVDSTLSVSFSCNCCVTPVGCYFRLQSVSFSFWVSYNSGSVSSVQEDASGGSVTYNVYSSDGTEIASNITQTIQWGGWTVASDKSYVERELVLQGTNEGYNTDGEARCWLRYYIPDTGLSSYSPSLSDFDLTNQLAGTEATSLGLTPFVYYGTDSSNYGTSFYYPLCETDATPCYAVYLGNSSQIAYTYDSSSSSYVPSVVLQGLSLYKTRYSDGTYSNIWGLQNGTSSGTGNIVRVFSDYNGFIFETEVPFNGYTSPFYVVFHPVQEITSAISGTLTELVESGVLAMSAYPMYNESNVGIAVFRDSEGNCACSSSNMCFTLSLQTSSFPSVSYVHYTDNSNSDYYLFVLEVLKNNTASYDGSFSFNSYNGDSEFDVFFSSDNSTLYAFYNNLNDRLITINSKQYKLKHLSFTMSQYSSSASNITYSQMTNIRALFEEYETV